MMMFDLLLHGGSAKPQISNVFCFYSSLEPVSLSLSLAVASFQNLIRKAPSRQRKRHSGGGRGGSKRCS